MVAIVVKKVIWRYGLPHTTKVVCIRPNDFMRFSIFRDAKDIQEKSERHRVIHWVWKTRLFYPLMKYMNRHISKFLVKNIEDIPNEPYNRNFKILYFSVEKGIEDWFFNFYGGFKNGKKDEAKYSELKEKWDKIETKNNNWWYIPKFFLNLLITVILEDTAYRELMNHVMFRIQGEMNRNYNPKIKHKFPLYINMYESFIPYFIEWMKVRGGGKVVLEVKPGDVKVKLKTRKTKKIELNKESVDRIESLDPKLQKMFKKELSQFILRMLGRVAPVPTSTKPTGK